MAFPLAAIISAAEKLKEVACPKSSFFKHTNDVNEVVNRLFLSIARMLRILQS